VHANNEGINNDTSPAYVQIIDITNGQTICKLTAKNKPVPGADGKQYPFIEFEKTPLSAEEIDKEKYEHQKRFGNL